MMASITRAYRFEAAHQLRNVPAWHKCSNMHGHTYRAEVTLRGEVDGGGMVMDFGALDVLMDALLIQFDHRVLNHLPDLEQNPTAENVAALLGKLVKGALGGREVTVRVYENPDMWAEVTC